MKYHLQLNVNGEVQDALIEPFKSLLDALRDEIGLIGAKRGCEDGRCGSCTVLVDGEPVKACLVLAMQAAGKKVDTIEGMAEDGKLHPLQEAFLEYGAVQCGYCAPGMLLVAKALLEKNPYPTEEDIRGALKGNLCRCGTYTNVTKAILKTGVRN